MSTEEILAGEQTFAGNGGEGPKVLMENMARLFESAAYYFERSPLPGAFSAANMFTSMALSCSGIAVAYSTLSACGRLCVAWLRR